MNAVFSYERMKYEWSMSLEPASRASNSDPNNELCRRGLMVKSADHVNAYVNAPTDNNAPNNSEKDDHLPPGSHYTRILITVALLTLILFYCENFMWLSGILYCENISNHTLVGGAFIETNINFI